MPLTVVEAHDSRRYSDNERTTSLTLIFIVKGTSDTIEAANADEIPRVGDFYGASTALKCVSRGGEVLKVADDEDAGACRIICEFEKPDPGEPEPPAGEDEFELDLTAQTAHITRALQQTHYPSSADVGDLIGVAGDQVEGVDVYVPRGAYRVAATRGALTSAYRNTVLSLVAKVNQTEWKGFAAGTLLFLGAVARRTGSNPWRVEYSFAFEPNAQFVVGTTAGNQNITKEGWDYVWYSQAKVSSEGDTVVQHKVASAHVARVYARGDFGQLGIGS